MWEKPENQNIGETLSRYISQLNTLLDKAGISQRVQGGILYRGSDNCDDLCEEDMCDYCDAYGDELIMITSNSVLQKQLVSLSESIDQQLDSSNRVFTRVNGECVEYIKHDFESVYGNIYIFARIKYTPTERKLISFSSTEWSTFIDIPILANYIVRQYISDVPLPSTPKLPPRYSDDQMLLSAGNAFMASLLKGFVIGNNNFVGDLNIISSLAYERQANVGNLVLLHRDYRVHSYNDNFLNDSFWAGVRDSVREIQLSIHFAEPVPMNNHKRVRKLFEIATGNTFLVGDGSYIYGVITRKSLKDQAVDRYILINIRGSLKWEVYEIEGNASKDRAFRVMYDGTGFKVKKKAAYRAKLESILENIKNNKLLHSIASQSSPCNRCDYGESCGSAIVQENADYYAITNIMAEIVQNAIEQKHGTTIVFSMHAKEEVGRLNRTCFQIEEVPLRNNKEIIKQITAIDGAVMCGFDGVCYAIGVILDGMAVGALDKKTGEGDGYKQEPEDISRGARYNSAIRYKNANPCSIICIVSEDGDVNII